MEITDEMILTQVQAGYMNCRKGWTPGPCPDCEGTTFVWKRDAPGSLKRTCKKCDPWKCGRCGTEASYYRIDGGKLKRACESCDKASQT